MRMRKKPNLIPRMERCAATLVTEPETLRGKWLETFPGHKALHLEIGCGKGRFTADTAGQNPDVFLAAIEKVPDAMVVGMERVTARQLTNVRFMDKDARDLLSFFAPGEVSRIYINFPIFCPWAARSGSSLTTTRSSSGRWSSLNPRAGRCARSRAICTQTAPSA